jgi:ADP-L-glycero-D-manno-heptose 6-epimerase
MKILVTGGFGFIGSSFVKYLNNKGITNIDICEVKDQYENKWFNAVDLVYNHIIYSENIDYIIHSNYDAIVHLGANSSTSQEANSQNWDNNIQYSNQLIKQANNNVNHPVIIFASSAATYGNETSDFSERLNVRPTNFYGFTKLQTEKAISAIQCNSNIYALRFFNVYGAREAHKVGMSSPIYKWLTSTSLNHTIELFESLNPLFPTGKMARDFIHVNDVCSVIWHCINSENKGGIYNVGSGVASTWEEVANCVFKTKEIKCGSIVYRNMTQSLSKHYQYYTCANLDKLRKNLCYNQEFLSLEEGIELTYKEIKEIYGNV